MLMNASTNYPSCEDVAEKTNKRKRVGRNYAVHFRPRYKTKLFTAPWFCEWYTLCSTYSKQFWNSVMNFNSQNNTDWIILANFQWINNERKHLKKELKNNSLMHSGYFHWGAAEHFKINQVFYVFLLINKSHVQTKIHFFTIKSKLDVFDSLVWKWDWHTADIFSHRQFF